MAKEKSGMDGMSKKFTFSKTVEGETFTANEFDSFDEAIKAVEKGLHDRKLATGPHSEGVPKNPKEGTHQEEKPKK